MFNVRKQEVCLFEALRSGIVQAEELPAELTEKATKHFENIEKNMITRERAELRMHKIVRGGPTHYRRGEWLESLGSRRVAHPSSYSRNGPSTLASDSASL